MPRKFFLLFPYQPCIFPYHTLFYILIKCKIMIDVFKHIIFLCEKQDKGSEKNFLDLIW
jgi:hypothetical protein